MGTVTSSVLWKRKKMKDKSIFVRIPLVYNVNKPVHLIVSPNLATFKRHRLGVQAAPVSNVDPGSEQSKPALVNVVGLGSEESENPLRCDVFIEDPTVVSYPKSEIVIQVPDKKTKELYIIGYFHDVGHTEETVVFMQRTWCLTGKSDVALVVKLTDTVPPELRLTITKEKRSSTRTSFSSARI